jgi:hypothetical protein
MYVLAKVCTITLCAIASQKIAYIFFYLIVLLKCVDCELQCYLDVWFFMKPVELIQYFANEAVHVDNRLLC